jgi:hypothetical protein
MAQAIRRRDADVRLGVAEGFGQRGDGRGRLVGDPADRAGRGRADFRVFVLEQADDRRHGRLGLRSDPHQREAGRVAEPGVAAAQHFGQGGCERRGMPGEIATGIVGYLSMTTFILPGMLA